MLNCRSLRPAALLVAGVTTLLMAAAAASSVLDHTVNDIDGKPVALTQYKGDVLLVVNTASKCGYTKQYAAMESVYQKYKDKGFQVLAFPANEFGGQEPGSNAQIKEFCTDTYHTTFPIFSKIVVKGDKIDPLYKHLTSKETDPKFAGPIGWNFTKFLINRKGEIVARFDSKVTPDSAELTKAIEAALAEAK